MNEVDLFKVPTGCRMYMMTSYMPIVNFLPLRPKLLKSLQNEGIFPLITMNVLIYASNLID